MIISTAGIFDTTLTETLPKEKSHFTASTFSPLETVVLGKYTFAELPPYAQH
jgi:hypothetical protein